MSARILGPWARLSGVRQKRTKVDEKEAQLGRMDPESGGADKRTFAYGAFRGCGGFVGHSDFVTRTMFVLAAPRLRFVSFSLRGSRLVLVLDVPRLRLVSLVLVCSVRVPRLRWFR